MLDWSNAWIFPKAAGWMISEKIPALSKRMGLFSRHLLPSSCYPPRGSRCSCFCGNFSDQNRLTTFTKDTVLLHLFGPAGVYLYIFIYWYTYIYIYTYTFLYVHINWFLNDGYTCFFHKFRWLTLLMFIPHFCQIKSWFLKGHRPRGRDLSVVDKITYELDVWAGFCKGFTIEGWLQTLQKEIHPYCWWPQYLY